MTMRAKCGLLWALLCLGGLAAAQAQTSGGTPPAPSVTYPYNGDANADGFIGTSDLLAILDLYGGAFEPEALLVDGMDLGVYLGVLEEAIAALTAAVGAEQASSLPAGTGLAPGTVMVWNGTVWEPIRLAGCKNFAYACNYDPAAYVHASELCTYFPGCAAVDAAGTGPCAGQPTVTYAGTEYELVEYGTRCWFRENLATAHYRNGTPIPTGLSNAEWAATGAGAWAPVAGCSACGYLYNGHAVTAAAGLCPTGFHVATDPEWTLLEEFVGGTAGAGRLIKVGPGASPGWDGTDATGFSGVPSGWRNDLNGIPLNYGTQGMWWTSTASSGELWYRQMYTGFDGVQRGLYPKRAGYSVRCVKDWP